MKLDNAFGMHEQALKLRSHRAEVLAGNIANADTPGYKARDFDFHKLLQQQIPAGETMRITSPDFNQTALADYVQQTLAQG